MEEVLQLLDKANRYRRLAFRISNTRDPAVQRILERAAEIEAEASDLVMRQRFQSATG